MPNGTFLLPKEEQIVKTAPLENLLQPKLSACSECSPGTFSTGGATTCEDCKDNYYNDVYRQSKCEECPVGYTASKGERSCKKPQETAGIAPALVSIMPTPKGIHVQFRPTGGCNNILIYWGNGSTFRNGTTATIPLNGWFQKVRSGRNVF